jgi:hypothetical protein
MVLGSFQVRARRGLGLEAAGQERRGTALRARRGWSQGRGESSTCPEGLEQLPWDAQGATPAPLRSPAPLKTVFRLANFVAPRGSGKTCPGPNPERPFMSLLVILKG